MSFSQLNPSASVLNTQQLGQLQQLASELNPIQQAWVSGYMAATSQMAEQPSSAVSAVSAVVPSQTLTIIYGSQTGNAKGIAEQLKQTGEHQGFTVALVNAADYKVKKLNKETHLILIVSTHGDGEPPEDAELLHKAIFANKAPDLSQLKYAVLALGDSSYQHYCQTGKEFDEQLAILGATRLSQRIDCDVDYDDDAQLWSGQVIELLATELKQHSDHSAAQVIPINPGGVMAHQYVKNNPFAATLLTSYKITGRDSAKDVRHIEIDLEGSGIEYLPGDSLGVWFNNDSALVDELLQLLSIEAPQTVEFEQQNQSLRALLINKLELTQLHPGFVKEYGQISANPVLIELSQDSDQLRQFIENRQVIDVVRQYPATITAQQLLKSLRKLTPRLYSIASAQVEVEQEVHLTVGVVSYDAFEQPHLGGASGYLAHQLAEDASVNVYVEPNHNFRLPQNPQAAVIMIGPGTGIAPFRAFLQQRDQQEQPGKNWLLFGNPHFTQDFLYQTELQDWLKRGVLTQLDVAFSRDQAEKVYVQDRLVQNGAAVYQWLEDGAHLYICGDGAKMAKDVHLALLSIIQLHSKRDLQQAEQYLSDLRSNKRYQKDVY